MESPVYINMEIYYLIAVNTRQLNDFTSVVHKTLRFTLIIESLLLPLNENQKRDQTNIVEIITIIVTTIVGRF